MALSPADARARRLEAATTAPSTYPKRHPRGVEGNARKETYARRDEHRAGNPIHPGKMLHVREAPQRGDPEAESEPPDERAHEHAAHEDPDQHQAHGALVVEAHLREDRGEGEDGDGIGYGEREGGGKSGGQILAAQRLRIDVAAAAERTRADVEEIDPAERAEPVLIAKQP